MTSWDETLSDNGIMMREGEAAKALALGVSEKTALSGSTASIDVSGMCSTVFQKISWGFCDALDQVISVIAPRFMDDNGDAYPSSLTQLAAKAGINQLVYGATNGEVRLRNAGLLFDSEYVYQRKLMLNLMIHAAVPVEDAVFTKTSLNANDWVVNGSTVSLPYSTNDLTTTSTSYYRGLVSHGTNVSLDASKRYYLYLDSLYQRADVALNGSTATSMEVYGGTSSQHTFTVERPGIPAVIDLTDIPFANGGNTLTIRTDNTSNFVNIPFDGLVDSYNILGSATLCAAGKLCFDPVTYGTRRCHLIPTSTGVNIKVAVRSHSNQPDTDYGWITANVYISGETTSLGNAATRVTIQPGATNTYDITLNINGTTLQENIWNVGSGKLFQVVLQLQSDTSTGTVDTIEECFGYRTFSASKHDAVDGGYGFTLNGSTCSLYGVSYHHWDRMPTIDEMDADWEIIAALKPKMIRFAYFPAMHYLLNKCDQEGIVAMLEIPWMYDFHNGEWDPNNMESYRNALRYRYQHNITANAVAMATEFYNHPSVLFYSIGTGIGVRAYHEFYPDQARSFITGELLPAVRATDSSRLVCIEVGGSYPNTWTDVSDVLMERMSSGWGSGSISDAVSEANTWNGKSSTLPVGFLDWSYGANPAHHVEWSNASTKPADTSTNNAANYPEEYQAYCVEQYTASALTLKWPVFNLYGAVFDFAASNVSIAGGKSGVLQTGLVTRDRSILKDAYYYLKAIWNSEPMVHVTQKRNMSKETSPITLRIYTNCNYVKVYSSAMTLLGTLEKGSGSYVVTKSVELDEGNNIFYVTGHATSSGEATCNDSVTVYFEDTSGTVHIQVYSDSAIVNSGRVNAVVLPSTEPQGITWSSDTPTIATVNSGGTVTVLLDGSATIRATSTSDNTITKTKVIPCYVRGATDSLYYKACSQMDSSEAVATMRGLTVTNNKDGTVTFDGTLSSGAKSSWPLWPSTQNSTLIGVNNRAMFPVWNIPGDQLLTCEIIGGTITGQPSGDTPITLTPVDQTYTSLSQAALKPLNEVNGNGDVNAKLITGSTLGFASFLLKLNYPNGTIFDNFTIRVQSYKEAASYYNAGLLESHMYPANTVVLHPRDSSSGHTNEHKNMYARNADGSHCELVSNPNNGTSIPGIGRVTDGFNIYNPVVSGSTIAVAGDVLKFTVIMKNWPPHYDISKLGNTTGEWSFVLWYADGTVAAKLKWAYQGDATGVDFTGGTASTTFIATKTVDCAGWYRTNFALAGDLDCTNTIVWQMKLEEVDPTNVPPNTITAYGGNRIVNTGYVSAVGDPLSANQSVTWSSSNTSVATVDNNGFVTVVSDGQCTFTATSTLDNTKTGSVTVSCVKITDMDLAGTVVSTFYKGSTVSQKGVTVTGGTDGTLVLGGTVTTSSEIGINVTPIASSADTVSTYFPREGISGDVLLWMEHLSGTVTNITGYSGYDFGVRVYDEANSEITAYRLNYKEIPTSNNDTQSLLVTGSTAGVRRIRLLIKRPEGTVFDDYKIRIGLRKYSSLGNVYNGGLLEPFFPSLCSMYKVSGKNTIFSRYEDGSFFLKINNSLTSMSTGVLGIIKLTGGYSVYTALANVPVTDVIATSGKTYTFTVTLLAECTFNSAKGSNGVLKFAVLGSSRAYLAELYHIQAHDYTNTFDNGTASVTFTASENVAAMVVYVNNISITNPPRIGVSLTEVT